MAEVIDGILIREVETKNIMTKSSLPVGGYSVNPYVGCTHACKYTCIKSGCNREAAKGSAYCWVHKPTKSNSSVSGSGSRPSGSSSSTKHKYTCIKDGCTREADKDSAYCWVHRPSKSSTKSSTSYSSKSSYSSSYSSSKKSYKTYDSYDDGYDAIYDDDDYDEDRYNSDPDYAAGVDDAMDELDW